MAANTKRKGDGCWNEDFWHKLFIEARQDGGLIISKVGPPSGSQCDHKESVWEYHQLTIQTMMARHRFVVSHESRNQVTLKPK